MFALHIYKELVFSSKNIPGKKLAIMGYVFNSLLLLRTSCGLQRTLKPLEKTCFPMPTLRFVHRARVCVCLWLCLCVHVCLCLRDVPVLENPNTPLALLGAGRREYMDGFTCLCLHLRARACGLQARQQCGRQLVALRREAAAANPAAAFQGCVVVSHLHHPEREVAVYGGLMEAVSGFAGVRAWLPEKNAVFKGLQLRV